MSGRLRQAGSTIGDWLFAPRPMHALVLLRVILGATIFTAYLLRLPEYGLLYGADSVAWSAPFRALFPGRGGGIAAWIAKPVVEALAAMAEPERRLAIAALYAGILLSSLAYAAGFLTRASALLTLCLHLVFARINPHSYWSWGMMLTPFVLYTALGPAGRWFSIDARIRAWLAGRPSGRISADEWVSPAWPLRLVQVHVCTMYLVAGFARVDHPGWLRGHMLFEALSFSLYSRFAYDWSPVKPVLVVLTYATFILEPLAPFLLWVPGLGTVWALLLVGMHVGLEVATSVGWWNFVMIAGLISFLPPSWLEKPFGRDR